MKVDAFFEGGGILGVSFIGAYKALTERGIWIEKAVGISSGSFVAALVICGYTANELIEMLNTNFTIFKQKTIISEKNYLGKPLSILLKKGIYDSQAIEDFVDKALQKKGVQYFNDVTYNGESNLKIIAKDFTNKRLLLLPNDLPQYDHDPGCFKIAKAVRMSCSIPFYYIPYILKSRNKINYIVDGGIIKDISTSIINNNNKLTKLTLRFKIKDKRKKWFDKINSSNNIDCANDNREYERLITIFHDGKIKPTSFDLNREQIIYLYNQGYKATIKFINDEFYKKNPCN